MREKGTTPERRNHETEIGFVRHDLCRARRGLRGRACADHAALFGHFHTGYAVAWYILGCSIVSIIATSLLHDYTNKDISFEYA